MERVRLLLALGASVTAQDEQGRTALVAAVSPASDGGNSLLIIICMGIRISSLLVAG
jgi:ankyrin repeat protein